jgi:hypothetical protein
MLFIELGMSSLWNHSGCGLDREMAALLQANLARASDTPEARRLLGANIH